MSLFALALAETEKFTVCFFAYLITITSQVHDLFWEQGSIQLAMMLQTNHCLLYLSVSFTHLKRSTDSVILMGRELCPFLFGLIWRLLQNGLYSLLQSIFSLCHFVCAPMCVRACAWESLHSACVLGLFVQFMYCNTLQRDGSKQCFIIKQVRLPFEGLTNVSYSPGPLWVCVQNITEAVVVGEVAAAAAIEVWEEWRLRIRVFKHRCPVQALIWLHLGTGCSVQWQFPRVQEQYCQYNKTLSKEHKPCETHLVGR